MIKEQIKKIINNKKLLADIILVSVILVIGLSVLIVYAVSPKEEGNTVEVFVKDKLVAKYSLTIDGAYIITGANGGTNTLVIEGGKAYVSGATCDQKPGQACYNQGKIHWVGQKIVCLPNEVRIVVTGEGGGIVDI